MGVDYEYCIDCNECLHSGCFLVCYCCEETISNEYSVKNVFTGETRKVEFQVCDLCINQERNKHLVVHTNERKYKFCSYCINFNYEYDDGTPCSIVDYVELIK